MNVVKETGMDTRTGISRGGWAGDVIWRAGAVGAPPLGGAVYTTASVVCDWAAAVMRKPLAKRRKRRNRKRDADGQTGRRTDRQTYRPKD